MTMDYTVPSINIHNAQSWNKETHPEGPGPSRYVDDIQTVPGKSNNDTLLSVTYRDGSQKNLRVQPQEAVNFAKADSKGRFAQKLEKRQ